MIEVVDLGLNNISSVVSAFEISTKSEIRVISLASESSSPRLLILPGTGGFGAAASRLKKQGFAKLINTLNQDSGVYVAGICLGMQLLGSWSEESPDVDGLNLIPGVSKRLTEFAGAAGRVPHVGWATLTRWQPDSFPDLPGNSLGDVYFSHSFHVVLEDDSVERIEVCDGSRRFVAAFRKDRVSGYQFHPEKSSSFGLTIIAEMLRWAGIEN